MSAAALGLMAACYAAGALASVLARWSGRLAVGVGHLAALAGAAAGLGVSFGVLLGDPGTTLFQPLPVLFPFARLSLAVDGLSAYFLLVISVVAVAASIYGPAYLRAHSSAAGAARQAAQVFALNVFLGCMAFVCCAGGVDRVLPVDVYIPGCPPRPEAILFGILVAVGRLDARRASGT